MINKSLEEEADLIWREALLPAKSLARYEDVFAKFCKWQKSKYSTDEPNENMLLVNLKEKSESLMPTSLWSMYSMLKRQFLV
jgi:hypothetical protein